MNCIVCGSLAAKRCDDMNLCLDHHLEKHEGQNSFIKKYGLSGLMKINKYIFCSYTKSWKKVQCRYDERKVEDLVC